MTHRRTGRVDTAAGLLWGLLAATMTFEKENSSPEEAMTAKERVLMMKASFSRPPLPTSLQRSPHRIASVLARAARRGWVLVLAVRERAPRTGPTYEHGTSQSPERALTVDGCDVGLNLQQQARRDAEDDEMNRALRKTRVAYHNEKRALME